MAVLTWRPRFAELEAEGRFVELIQELNHLDRDTLDQRCLASLARAWAFSGSIERARSILLSLKDHELSDDARVVSLLAQSRMARMEQQWDRSLTISQEAYGIASSKAYTHLEADALASLAASYLELDRLLPSLDCYQRISQNPNVTPYRRNLAYSKQTWILWDLGECAQIQEILDRMPAPDRVRMELLLDLNRGDLSRCEKLIAKPDLDDFLPQHHLKTVVLVVRGAYVFENEPMLEEIRNGWIRVFLKKHLKDAYQGLEAAYSSRILSLLGEGRSLMPDFSKTTWRERLEIHLLDVLLMARDSSRDAQEFYRQAINPVLERKTLRCPAIPVLSPSGFSPESAWSNALSKCIGARPPSR